MERPTERDACLCCGQFVTRNGQEYTTEDLERQFELLTSLGYTRQDLLTKHRAQCEYQIPGLIEWLTAQ